MSPTGLEDVRNAFNRIASDYDSVLTRNPINAWMHEVNMSELSRAFPPETALLELGCGTGTVAIGMARRGCRVLALDISDDMVSRAAEKARASGLEDRLKFLRGRSADLLELTRHSPWLPFDGAYANFSLTYEESLEAVARSLAAVLKPGGIFICTLPNRMVLSELLLYGPQLRFDKVLWRFQRPLMKDVHGSLVATRAYSPWQVREAFRACFALEGVLGIPTFLPPTYLHLQYSRLAGGHRLFQALDRTLARRRPWNRLGEHTLFKFRRRQG